MKRYILILSLSLIVLSGYSQTKWTLRQCIDYAIENNIEVKQQEISVEKAKNNLSTSKNSRLPDLNATGSYGFKFSRSNNYSTNQSTTPINSETRSGNSSGGSFDIKTSIPVFTGFKITNENKANELNLKAATEGLKRIKENKELEITGYYLEVLFKKELLKVNVEQMNLDKEQVVKTEILVNTGKVPLSQLYDIKAQLAKDELNITNAENDLTQALLNLSQSLNLNELDNFDIVEPAMDNFMANNQSSLQSPADIYQTALTIKPHIKEAQLYVESSKKSLKVAQSGYYPTLNLGAGYGSSAQRMYGVSNLSFGRQWKDNGSEYVTLSLNIPIFNRFQTRNNVRAARLDIFNQELNLDNVKLNLYKEIQQAYQNALASQSKYVSTQKSLDAALEAFSYAQERYNVGKLTVFELNESQTKLFSSKSEQAQAKYDFVFRAKILDFFMGKEIYIE